MTTRVSIAFLLAALAHLGAYAVILITAPQEPNVQVQGGRISISLAPVDSAASEQSEHDGEMDPEQNTSVEESALEPDSAIKQPESEPEPEPEQSESEPTTEPELMPEPESQPAPEPETLQESMPAESEAPTRESAATGARQPAALATAQPQPRPHDQSIDGSDDSSATDSQASESASASEIVDTQLGNAAEDNYNGALMRHMRRARKFDTDARRSSKISITIDAQGHVLEIRVIRRSGDKAWDRRVVKELKRIAPYPAPPSGGTHTWSFDAVPK